jgi:hypothetical protein
MVRKTVAIKDDLFHKMTLDLLGMELSFRPNGHCSLY